MHDASSSSSSSPLAGVRLFVSGLSALPQALLALEPFPADVVCDAVWLADEELSFALSSSAPPSSGEDPAAARRQRLCDLVQALAGKHLDALCCTLSLETLERCRLVGDVDKTRVVLRRVNTNLKFRQNKFNLVRESSEGFAKLVCELLLLEDQHKEERVLALMGEFQLDPNRVLDLTIDLLPRNPRPLARLIAQLFCAPPSTTGTSSSNKKIVDLLQFKLNRTGGGDDCKELLDSVALLVVHGLLPVPHLIALLQHCGNTTTTTTTTTLIEGAFAALVAVPGSWRPFVVDFLALVSAQTVFSAAAAGPSSSAAVKAFQTMLLQEISPLYESLYQPAFKFTSTSSPTSSTSSTSSSNFGIATLDAFAAHIPALLVLVGAQAVSDSTLLTRLVRLLGKVQQQQADEASSLLTQVCGQVLLPALSLLPTSNPQVARELWTELVERLPAVDRFALYHAWASSTTSTSTSKAPAALVRAKKDAQSSLKRFCLDAAKNVFPMTQLSKAAHNNPLAAFETVFQGIRMQVDVAIIDAIVCAFQLMTPLALDVLVFLLCRELSTADAGSSEANAVSNARLVAKLFAQEHKVDYSPLTHVLLINCSSQRNLLGTLACLEEMVQHASGLHIVNEYDDTLLRSAAGGKLLRFLSRLSQDDKLTFSTQPEAAKTQQDQLDHLVHWMGQDGGMHGRLLRALARTRALAFQSSTTPHAAAQAALFDSCTSSLIQLADVLKSQNVVGLDAVVAGEEGFSRELRAHILRGNSSDASSSSSSAVEEKEDADFWRAALADVLYPKDEYKYELDRMAALRRPSASHALMQQLRAESEQSATRELAFKSGTSTVAVAVVDSGFLTRCILPRMLFSQEDALFCALYLQQRCASPDSSSVVLELVFGGDFLQAAFFPATDREMQCVGIFLAEMLAWASKNDDAAAYKRSCGALVDVIVAAMQCMQEDVLVSHAFQLAMHLLSRDQGGLFPGSPELAELFAKRVDEDVLVTFAFTERSNLLLQKLRRRFQTQTAPSTTTTPMPPASSSSAAPKPSSSSTSPSVSPTVTPAPIAATTAATSKPAAAASHPPPLARRTASITSTGSDGKSKLPPPPPQSTATPPLAPPSRSHSRNNAEDTLRSTKEGRGGGDRYDSRQQPQSIRGLQQQKDRHHQDESSSSSRRDESSSRRGEESGRRDEQQSSRRNDPPPPPRRDDNSSSSSSSRRDEPSSSSSRRGGADEPSSSRRDDGSNRRDEPPPSRRNESRRDEQPPARDSRREEQPSSSRRDDNRRDEPRRDDNRRDEPRRDDNNRRDEPRRDDNSRRDEPRRDDRRGDDNRRDEQPQSRRGNSVDKQASRRGSSRQLPTPPPPPPPTSAPPPPPPPLAQSRNRRSPPPASRQSKRHREDDRGDDDDRHRHQQQQQQQQPHRSDTSSSKRNRRG